jgi:hypothetical protein
MNDELERRWKGAVVAYIEELSSPSPGETEEKYEKSQCSRDPG